MHLSHPQSLRHQERTRGSLGLRVKGCVGVGSLTVRTAPLVAMLVMGAAVGHMGSLCLPLSFAWNLKLL